jgi:dTDP-4-amino-4,6-dideoxygalactose transaminase
MILTADPKAAYLAHAAEIQAALQRVLESGRYILGPECEAFESEFAGYLGGGHCLGVANGTEAIELALRAVGVGAGDRVVTVANTVSATISAIQQLGARPVFVDIDPVRMTMSPAALEACLAKEAATVKAILPVHLYGLCADMPALSAIAQRRGIALVEDCAQAQGAEIQGRKAGTWGACAAFSFYPTKNLGALGDGGAVFTRDSRVAEQVRLLRQYGWRERYLSEIPGRNSRLDEMQAAVLRVKLRHLDAENARRNGIAQHYLKALAGSALQLPGVPDDSRHVWHQFVLRSPRREALRAHLAQNGIQAAVLYPIPCHQQPAYAQPGLCLPETEKACSELLCLPCHPGLSDAQVNQVIQAVLSVGN